MSDYSFPVESIDLPSGGKFYPEGHPLRSGKIGVKYMTAKEEDILTSTNLIKKGTVLDKLMESLIVTKGVKPEDLLLGDLNAVMVAARILAYGKDYNVQLGCSSCGKRSDYAIDLSALQTIASDFDEKLLFKDNHSIKHILQEAKKSILHCHDAPTKDAAIIINMQKIQHYEMACYGSLKSFAKHFKLHHALELLEESSKEEGYMDKKLTEIAEGTFFDSGINAKARRLCA